MLRAAMLALSMFACAPSTDARAQATGCADCSGEPERVLPAPPRGRTRSTGHPSDAVRHGGHGGPYASASSDAPAALPPWPFRLRRSHGSEPYLSLLPPTLQPQLLRARRLTTAGGMFMALGAIGGLMLVSSIGSSGGCADSDSGDDSICTSGVGSAIAGITLLPLVFVGATLEIGGGARMARARRLLAAHPEWLTSP